MTLHEFPPSYAMVRKDHELLYRVWKPHSETYPAIDFVIFVRIIFNKVARIIALVFQSKYSDKTVEGVGEGAVPGAGRGRAGKDGPGRTLPEFKTSIDKGKVATAYERAMEIMGHVGWAPETVIYVQHADRHQAKTVVEKPPGPTTNDL